MTNTEIVLTALVMLLGEEDKDYIFFERDLDEWKLVGYLKRN